MSVVGTSLSDLSLSGFFHLIKTLYLSSVKDRHGVFAFISKDERRDLPLRKQCPSIRAQLKEEQSKKAAAPKKAAAKAKDNDLEV